MSYEYPNLKLSKDPLSLVLCQVRFSAIRKMPDHIPDIQDRLRRKGFPIDASGSGQTLVVTQGPEGMQTDVKPIRRDEFRSKDGHWSVSIGIDALSLVTTAYDRYKGFSEKLELCLQEVNAVAELNLCQVLRIGIRYIDVIEPSENETFRDYLKEPLHGLRSDVYLGGKQVIQSQTIGSTKMGTMSVRIWQNNHGQLIPPDILQGKPMPTLASAEPGKLITLVDTDHFVEGTWDFDIPKVLETSNALHQGANRAWFNDVITPHALNKWGATNA